MCIDSSSGALVIGTEATFHNDPRPRVRPGPMEGLDSPPFECVALYIATQADAGKTGIATEQMTYLQVETRADGPSILHPSLNPGS